MGETRVDIQHLLEDLRDAYPGALEETILTEIVANSLDSGAGRISLAADVARSTLTIVDDGCGMRRRDLVRYHDLAASSKSRGQGIGFAGVGIKLGLLACEEVITESRRGKEHVASRWLLAARHKAPWKWIPPLGLVENQGTAVVLHLHNALSPLLDEGYLEAALRRQFQPLFESEFDEILSPHYPKRILFEVGGRLLDGQRIRAEEVARLAVCLARKRKPSAVGYLLRTEAPLPEDKRGVAVSTFGKVIKHGWDWLGITPATPDRVAGVIEVPALAAALTLNKGDFVRVGARGALYLSYRKAIQEAVAKQFAAWGDVRPAADQVRRRSLRPLERDLAAMLVEMAEDFPLLASLVEKRAGGQKRLPIGGEAGEGNPRWFTATTVTETIEEEQDAAELADPVEVSSGEPKADQEEQRLEENQAPPGEVILPGTGGRTRPMRYGLGIRFEHHADDVELARLVESSVVINEAHPTYRRAVASRSEGYHIALCVALALARLAVEPKDEHAFVTTFMTRWGEALDSSARRVRKRR
ncbi:MAG: hypothetical protein OJF52_004440 [Nitrospira sp.]|jgi:hypothetical protein|nr:MAG: hypothetical protein OJF52_004440 [Nitrospira sp.]